MTELEILQENYELCKRKMSECSERGDDRGFKKWLTLSSKANKAIDKLIAKSREKEKNNGENIERGNSKDCRSGVDAKTVPGKGHR